MTPDPAAGNDDQGDGGFQSDNDAPGGSTDTGDGDDISDMNFASNDPDAEQMEGSDPVPSGGRGSLMEPDGPQCLTLEEAQARQEGFTVDLPSCEQGICTKAHCVPDTIIPEEQANLLASCEGGDGFKCVPDSLTATLGMAPLPPCTSIGGAEGRCVSACVPLVAAQADVLSRDVCADDELCAPCFDPITQEDTGACSLECDTGPVDDPVFFDGCCGDIGVCVPKAFVPTGQADLLGVDTCTGTDELCAPRELAADRSLVPPSCTSLEGAEGRCLADCIPDVARQADQLPRDTCAEGYLCAPCFDPISGEDTGACSIGDDPGPAGGPVLFAGCCNDGSADVGVCVPRSIVPADQVDLLGPDTCTGTDYLCAPADVAAGEYVPDPCVSLGDGEGRCLPACLPDIAAQAALLEQADCAAGELCAPCWDPVTGGSTGACELEGDAPDDGQAVFTFPDCCPDGDGGFLSSCVPVEAVPEDQVSLLDATGCNAGTELCAPKDVASGSYVPNPCTAPGGLEARCLPACLPDVAAQADSLTQEDCAAGYLCAPCFDPFTGADTGACTLEGDMPANPTPTAFATCCDAGGSDVGTCVPTDLVPGDLQSLLDDDGGNCADLGGDATLCAPTDVATGTYVPDTCRVPGDIEGRCMPACLPDIAAQADSLTQEDCAAGYLCAPCYDPFDQSSTGACELEGDTPSEPPVVLATCCNDGSTDVGTCVPQGLVPSALQSMLDDDGGNCTDLGGEPTLCAPTDVASGTYVPDPCTAPGGLEARCLPACLPDIAAQADFLTQEDCDAGELCAPCYDPFTGDDTGACTLEGDMPTPPATTFATCCSNGSSDVGTCVPTDFVPGDLQSLLDDDGGVCMDMGGDATLCAPTDVATDTYAPESCQSWHGDSTVGGVRAGPGRCLPACLPDIVALADLLTPDGSDGCDDPDERCAPCHDPRTGESTGACALPGDTEPGDPVTFTNCCSDQGRCIPTTAAGDRAGSLPTLTCEDAGEPGAASTEAYLCAPNAAVDDPSHTFQSCTTECDLGVTLCFGAALLGTVIGGQAGVCLPACMLSETDTDLGTADVVYGQGDCPNAGEDCAPCIDPQTDLSTGACD